LQTKIHTQVCLPKTAKICAANTDNKPNMSFKQTYVTISSWSGFEIFLTGKEHVHELTVGRSGAHLLDLGVGGAEAVVDPGEHVVSGEVVRRHGGAVHVHGHLDASTGGNEKGMN